MMKYKFKKNNRKVALQKGNSLIEAMVSLTILSFGLLGIAGLLLASAGQQKNSQSYGLASLLVNDITERMRANKADLSLPTNNYTTPNVVTYAQALQNNSSFTSPDPEQIDCNSLQISCTAPGSVAVSDMRAWMSRISTELPGGAARITLLNNDDVTSRQVVVMWNDKAANQAEQNSTTPDNVNCPANVISTSTPSTVRCITVSFRP